jgi:hypothetical protein
MGNRSGGSRRKQRENAYTYSESRRGGDYSRRKKYDGSVNGPPAATYPRPLNGYTENPVTQTTISYNRSNSSKQEVTFLAFNNDPCFLLQIN